MKEMFSKREDIVFIANELTKILGEKISINTFTLVNEVLTGKIILDETKIARFEGIDFNIKFSKGEFLRINVGEIYISETSVNAILSTNRGYSVRDAIRNPNYNIATTIFDDETLNHIPYFDNIYKYIVENKLKNIIVEFALFDKPVGINKENIIIYELRTDY